VTVVVPAATPVITAGSPPTTVAVVELPVVQVAVAEASTWPLGVCA